LELYPFNLYLHLPSDS